MAKTAQPSIFKGVKMLSLIIATATLNPLPIPSEPCRTVATPHGNMCVVSQSLKVYGVIRTQRETDARHICHGWAGSDYQIWATAEPKEWLCVNYES